MASTREIADRDLFGAVVKALSADGHHPAQLQRRVRRDQLHDLVAAVGRAGVHQAQRGEEGKVLHLVRREVLHRDRLGEAVVAPRSDRHVPEDDGVGIAADDLAVLPDADGFAAQVDRLVLGEKRAHGDVVVRIDIRGRADHDRDQEQHGDQRSRAFFLSVLSYGHFFLPGENVCCACHCIITAGLFQERQAAAGLLRAISEPSTQK